MFNSLWHNFFFDPVYNGLVFFIDVIPGGDVGLAIIAIVILVKVLLLPLSIKAVRTQKILRELEPKLKALKEKHKGKREEEARAIMELYREAGLNPFSSILLLFIQIPFIIALYFSVYSGGGVALPAINTALLYSFIPAPETVSMIFLGLLNIENKSIALALVAAVTQFIQTKISLPAPEPRKPDAEPNFKEDFARNMQLQMRYGLPLIIFFVAYATSAAIALYFVVSNLVAIAQEQFVKKHK